MITVIVTYRVNPEFADQNKVNIQKFLKDFKALNSADFQYKVYMKEDNITSATSRY